MTYKVVDQFHGETHDILRTGISAPLEMAIERYGAIFARVGMFLADIPALAEIINCKGHSAIKPCWLCMSATHHKPPAGAAPMHLFSDYCTPITETRINKFKRHNNVSLREALKKLQALKGTITDTELEFRESNIYGFNWGPRNILTEDRFAIDAIDASMNDWHHTYVSGGIGDTEFGTFMREMHRSITQDRLQHSCTYPILGVYLSQWRWPKIRGNPMHLFDDEHAKRFIKAGDFGSNASEFLTLAPIIGRFLTNVIKPQTAGTHVEPLVASMIAVLSVIDLLQGCKVTRAVDPDKLRIAIKAHIDLYKLAYGEDAIRFKHHAAIHLPDQLAFWKRLLGTLTLERKHRAAKMYGRGRMTLQSFETSVLSGIFVCLLYEQTKSQTIMVASRTFPRTCK